MEERFVKNKDVTNDNNSSPKKFRLIFSDWLLIVMVLALILFLSSAVVTRQDQFSIILQFGKIVRVVDEPGLTFKIPVIQNVERREQKILFYNLPRTDVITSDKKAMIVDSYVLWRITDPIKYYQRLSGLKVQAEGRIDAVVYNAIKNTISSMTQEEVILSRDGRVNVSAIELEIEIDTVLFEDENLLVPSGDIEIKSLTREIASNLVENIAEVGIEIITVEVKALDLPESNKNAVYNRMISEREKVTTMYKSEGEAEAQMIRNQADKDVSVMLSEARAEAAKIIADGEAEYMQILSTAYNEREKSDFYEFVRALEAAKVAYRNNRGNILMLDKNSPLAQLFYDFSINPASYSLTGE